MPRVICHRKLTSTVLGSMLGVFIVIGGSTCAAFAEDSKDTEDWYDQKFLRSFLRGLGLQNGQEGKIEYKERPPLVVPPTRNLPPPETTGSIGQRDPAWPTDPDEAKIKAAKKAQAERKTVNPLFWGDSLKPSEMAVGKTDALPNEQGLKPGQTVETSTQLRPDELGYKGGLWDDFLNLGHTFDREKPVEGAKFLREPSRAALTDPPSGYRSPSPDQPYGLNYRSEKGKALTQEERQTEGSKDR
jgi:hypothetical protein